MNRWLCVLALAAAATSPPPMRADDTPGPAETSIGKKPVILKAQFAGGILIVETKGRDGPYHFLVDTGSARTLVSADVAADYPAKGPPPVPAEVPVRSADGKVALLPAAMLSRLTLGGARFESVPVLVFDCSPLSDELGVRIDGVLGYSLFHDTLLTLDYPHSQVILRSPALRSTLTGNALAAQPNGATPVVTARLGDRDLPVLLDSGKDLPLSLDRHRVRPGDFAFGPVDGPTVHDLVGDHRQRVGRLGGSLRVGGYAVPRSVAELSDDLSAIGGGILKLFTVTFDPEQNQVYFQRDASDPIAIPGERSPGLSFSRTPAYWRVAGVIPGSPAAAQGVSAGDLVTKIEGEAVSNWSKDRYDRLIANADKVRYTFLFGIHDSDKTLNVVDLVP